MQKEFLKLNFILNYDKHIFGKHEIFVSSHLLSKITLKIEIEEECIVRNYFQNYEITSVSSTNI